MMNKLSDEIDSANNSYKNASQETFTFARGVSESVWWTMRANAYYDDIGIEADLAVGDQGIGWRIEAIAVGEAGNAIVGDEEEWRDVVRFGDDGRRRLGRVVRRAEVQTQP